jgi:hypothetical protein
MIVEHTYEIIDQDIYNKILDMMDIIPKFHKIMYGIQYHYIYVDDRIKCFYPSLGLSTILL